MSAIPRGTHEYPTPSVFDRSLDLSRINLDLVAYVGLIVLSIITHLWGLGHMAMHHDESIHAWMSWRFYAGVGPFNCAAGRVASTYCYDPVYHGPALYVLTLISYFLFGDGNAQARLPEALTGILLVASSWMLRPYFGKRGALLAGTLLALAPSLLYFTRFARHDGLMVLWTFWLVIGLFRYLDSGQARFLYLAAAGTALAMATHELYYILFFLFGSFLMIRTLYELLPRRTVIIGLMVVFTLSLIIEIINPQITPNLAAGGLALLAMTVFGLGILMVRVWDERPVVTERAQRLWREERATLWTALAILVAIYVVLYSTFFADPRGIVDGLYQGLAYWLGSQHKYARGGQPWYYYLMLLPIYEPLALFGGLAGLAYLMAGGNRTVAPLRLESREWGLIIALILEVLIALYLFVNGLFGLLGIIAVAALIGATVYGLWLMRRNQAAESAEVATSDQETPPTDGELSNDDVGLEKTAFSTVKLPPTEATQSPVAQLFPLFLAFWFFGALVAFSWAGEKMPWLLTHIALPGNLLVAWALGRVIDSLEWRNVRNLRALLIPIALILLLVALGVAVWRLSASATGQQGQANLLQGLVPLAIVGGLIYGLLTIGQRVGGRATLVLCTLTVAGLVGVYMLRSTWMVVYVQPDTPREPLIYTQSTPDVPLIVAQIRELAINQTRNQRSSSDPIGGLSMPVIMDSGAADGEGSLAWPYQWYFRDFQRIENRNADFFRDATAESFQVAVDGRQPNGEKEFAPVVMVYVPHVTDATRQALEANYTLRYNSKLNWWFPEGNRCDPQAPGYKRFYYSVSQIEQARKECNNPALDPAAFGSQLTPILWPFDRMHWPDTRRFLLYRELPEPLRLDGREMQVWVRNDLAASGSSETSAAGGTVKLVAQQVIGAEGGALNQPRGVAVDANGNVYVANTGSHAIEVFGPDGVLKQTIGGLGNGEGQFNEPRGVAVDQQGNIYVADTWNARVVKLDPAGTFVKAWGEGKQDFGSGRRATMTDGTQQGNAAETLGLFGPRAVALDSLGNVYIADTGNKRIVVTNTEGEYRYQWGYEGNQPGAFNEPIGIAVDGQNRVYVADTWNSRVQVFDQGENKQVNPIPSVVWNVSGWLPNTYDDPFVAASPGGQVFATVPGRNQVIYANTRGDVLLRWGGKGTDFASLTTPSGAAVGPDGTLYVVDRGNNRVLRFTLPEAGPATLGR